MLVSAVEKLLAGNADGKCKGGEEFVGGKINKGMIRETTCSK
jgi:hypothetical protein